MFFRNWWGKKKKCMSSVTKQYGQGDLSGDWVWERSLLSCEELGSSGSLLSPTGICTCQREKRAQAWKASVHSRGNIPKGSLEDQEEGCAHRDVIFHNREERGDRMTGRLSTSQWQEVGDHGEGRPQRTQDLWLKTGVLWNPTSPSRFPPESRLIHTCFL